MLPLDAFGLWPRVFSSFFASFFNTIDETQQKGGDVMDEDNDIFEMFLELITQAPWGGNVPNTDPQYTTDSSVAQFANTKYIER